MRAGEPWQRAAKGAAAKSPQVHSATCLYADFDAKDFDPDLKAAAKKYKEYMKQGRKMDPTKFSGALSPEKGKAIIREHIASLPIQPSATVDSGGGINAYWFFDEPFIFSEGDGGMARIEKLQEAWVWVVGADKNAKDMTRVLRKPGSYNRKGCYDPTPRLVRVDNLFVSRLYPLVDLEAHVNEALPSVLTEWGAKNQGGKKIVKGRMGAGLNIPELIDLSGVAVGELEDVWGAPRTIVRALERLDMARCDGYDSWIKVGLVLFNESDGADWGLTLFSFWSRKSARYSSGATTEVWKRFGDHKREGEARLMRGSLIKWAISDSNSREWLAVQAHAHLYRDGFDVHWPNQTGAALAKAGETQINVIPKGYKLGQCWSIRSLATGTNQNPRRFGLIAPTGVGKTTLSMFDPYTVLFVPYRLLAISTWEDYSDRYGKDDVALIIGGRAIEAQNPTRFIVLYDCADVLVDYLQQKHKDDGVDIFLKYVVYVDEAHQLVYAAIFRNRAVRGLIEVIIRFYNVFFMTATYLPLTPGTEGAEIIRFESEVPHVRDLYIGAIGDVAKAVDQIIVHEAGGSQAGALKHTITWYAKDETGSYLVQHQKRITEWAEASLPQHTDARLAVIEKMTGPSYEVDYQRAMVEVGNFSIDQAKDVLTKMVDVLSADTLIKALGYVYNQDQYLNLFLEQHTPILIKPDEHPAEYDEMLEHVRKSWPDLKRTLRDISESNELLPLQQAGIPQDPDVIRELLDEWRGLPVITGTNELPSQLAIIWLNDQLAAISAKGDVKLGKITAFLTDAHERIIDKNLKDLHYEYVKAMVLLEHADAPNVLPNLNTLVERFDALVNADSAFREVIGERERARQQSLITPAIVVFRNNKVMNQVTQKNLHEKGYNFMRFDSDVKHTEEFKELMRKQRLPESVDGLLATGVYSDGHNVYANPKESLNFGPRVVRTVYVSGGRGAIGISTVDQSDERIRDHLGNVGTIIGMSFNKKPKPIYINNLDVTITGDMWTDIPIILGVLKDKADRGLDTMQSLVDLAAKKGEKAYKDQYRAYLKTQLRHTGHRVVIKSDKDGKLVRTVSVDMLVLRARAQEVFNSACWQSTELMIRALNGVSQSIYAFRGPFTLKTAFTEDEKDAFNAECKKIRDDTQERELDALDELRLFKPKEVFNVAQDPDGDLDQRNAAIYLLACLGVDIEQFSAIDHIHAMAEQVQLTLHNVLERIVKPAAYTKLRNRGDAQPKSSELLGRFKVGDALTREDLDELAFELEGQLFLKQELANTYPLLGTFRCPKGGRC
ncbi:MAG: PriCT-2 domain-containing protein [Ardenticatenaceae bacterium]